MKYRIRPVTGASNS